MNNSNVKLSALLVRTGEIRQFAIHLLNGVSYTDELAWECLTALRI